MRQGCECVQRRYVGLMFANLLQKCDIGIERVVFVKHQGSDDACKGCKFDKDRMQILCHEGSS